MYIDVYSIYIHCTGTSHTHIRRNIHVTSAPSHTASQILATQTRTPGTCLACPLGVNPSNIPTEPGTCSNPLHRNPFQLSRGACVTDG